MGRYNMAVNSGSLPSNYQIPPATLPAPIFGQEWRYLLQPVGQDPLDLTPTVQNANPNMGIDDSLTWARAIAPSPLLDYSIDHVSLLRLFRSYVLVMEYMSFLSSNPH